MSSLNQKPFWWQCTLASSKKKSNRQAQAGLAYNLVNQYFISITWLAKEWIYTNDPWYFGTPSEGVLLCRPGCWHIAPRLRLFSPIESTIVQILMFLKYFYNPIFGLKCFNSNRNTSDLSYEVLATYWMAQMHIPTSTSISQSRCKKRGSIPGQFVFKNSFILQRPNMILCLRYTPL